MNKVNMAELKPGQRLKLRNGGAARYLEFRGLYPNWPYFMVTDLNDKLTVISCGPYGYIYSYADRDSRDVVGILPPNPPLDSEWVLRYRMYRIWGAPL